MSAHPAVPVSAEDYAQLVDCRCRAFAELPDVHPAGVCARLQRDRGGERTDTAR